MGAGEPPAENTPPSSAADLSPDPDCFPNWSVRQLPCLGRAAECDLYMVMRERRLRRSWIVRLLDVRRIASAFSVSSSGLIVVMLICVCMIGNLWMALGFLIFSMVLKEVWSRIPKLRNRRDESLSFPLRVSQIFGRGTYAYWPAADLATTPTEGDDIARAIFYEEMESAPYATIFVGLLLAGAVVGLQGICFLCVGPVWIRAIRFEMLENVEYESGEVFWRAKHAYETFRRGESE